MTGTEGEKWKEMPKRCRHGAMRRDNPYVGMRKKEIANKLRAGKLRAGS